MTAPSSRLPEEEKVERTSTGLRSLGLTVVLVLLATFAFVTVPLHLQVCLVVVALLAALPWSRQHPGSRVLNLAFVLLSCFASLRYANWRVRTVGGALREGNLRHVHGFLGDVVLVLVLGAELYSFMNLGLTYLQTAWPLNRKPVPLPADVNLWPEIDLLIPTLDEPLHVVKSTILASLHLDWPAGKLQVHLLDDGNRDAFRAFCAKTGIGYLPRERNDHAKAGNLNHALRRLEAPFVAVLNADHVPVRSFLQVTMGWFDRDPHLALVQTPHHFSSRDAFERNLPHAREIPGESELFFGVVQDGNDLWNASRFCGSSAVIRRAALNDVGGFAQETATEDAHTSLRLHTHGWNTAYLNLPQTAGHAPQSLSSHIRQRMRWARGMAQMLRRGNPLFASGLTLAQRMCYFHAMARSFSALPRLIFLLAPLLYLAFGFTTIPGSSAAIAAFALPHLVFACVARARLHGRYRHMFWNQICETVLAPYTLWPALGAFFSRSHVRFRSIAKEGSIEETIFDTRIAGPFLVLMFANLLGLVAVVLRFLAAAPSTGRLLAWHAPGLQATLYAHGGAGFVWISVGWTFFNLIVLSVALGVAQERQQRRRAVRVAVCVPVHLHFPDGKSLPGETIDASQGGVMVRVQGRATVAIGEPVTVTMPVLGEQASFPATIVQTADGKVRMEFDPLNSREEETLAVLLYARADAWVAAANRRQRDRPLRSLGKVAAFAWFGASAALRNMLSWRPARPSGARLSGAVLIASVALPIGVLALRGHTLRAQYSVDAISRSGVPGLARGADREPRTVKSTKVLYKQRTLSLDALHPSGPITLDESTPSAERDFTLPTSEIVQHATLHLNYRWDPDQRRSGGTLRVLLNGAVVASAPLDALVAAENGAGRSPAIREEGTQSLSVELPPELFVPSDQLSFQMDSPGLSLCRHHGCASSWVRVEPNAAIILTLMQIEQRPAAKPTHDRTLGFMKGFGSVNWPAELVDLALCGAGTIGLLGVCLLGAVLLGDSLAEKARKRLHPSR